MSNAGNVRMNIVDVDLRNYRYSTLKTDLKLCLTIIDVLCSKRDSLRGFEWLSMFYLLSAISIVQSILIATDQLAELYCERSSENGHSASRIQSAYTVLVNIFSWATGAFDPLHDSSFGRSPVDYDTETAVKLEAIYEAQRLAEVEKWNMRNIRSTKDFLMRLGKGKFQDGTFIGFIGRNSKLAKDILGELRKLNDENGTDNDMSVPKKETGQTPVSRTVSNQTKVAPTYSVSSGHIICDVPEETFGVCNTTESPLAISQPSRYSSVLNSTVGIRQPQSLSSHPEKVLHFNGISAEHESAQPEDIFERVTMQDLPHMSLQADESDTKFGPPNHGLEDTKRRKELIAEDVRSSTIARNFVVLEEKRSDREYISNSEAMNSIHRVM
jgi:hypothetical protein